MQQINGSDVCVAAAANASLNPFIADRGRYLTVQPQSLHTADSVRAYNRCIL